jgi:hypothetical protein
MSNRYRINHLPRGWLKDTIIGPQKQRFEIFQSLSPEKIFLEQKENAGRPPPKPWWAAHEAPGERQMDFA